MKGHWYDGGQRFEGDICARIYRHGAPALLLVTVGESGLSAEWGPAQSELVATFARWIAIEEWVGE